MKFLLEIISSNSVLNLIDDWIDKNHEVKLVGWDPYPTSLRIVNWIKWDLLNNKFLEYQKISLFNQGLYLEKLLKSISVAIIYLPMLKLLF